MIEQAHSGANGIPSWISSAQPSKYGGIVLCRSGNAVMRHNFQTWDVVPGAVLTFFPNDVIHLEPVSDDFYAEILRYSPDILREASMHIEDVVYEWLRNDCCNVSEKVSSITAATFDLLRIYLSDRTFMSSDRILLLHLKAYFLGLYDHVRMNHAGEMYGLVRRNRIHEQFNLFMEILEKEYRDSHDVSYYAGRLSITPKHLTAVTKKIAGQPAKEIIDQYLIMQIRLVLSETSRPVKEIAWDFNFPSFSFFCRFFRHRTGQTPLQYRQSCKGNVQ